MKVQDEDRMKAVTPLWESRDPSSVPALAARAALVDHVAYLRASNGALPNFQVVEDTIEFGRDGTVTFVMVDYANFRQDDGATAATLLAMQVPRGHVKSALRHVRDLACAPFN